MARANDDNRSCRSWEHPTFERTGMTHVVSLPLILACLSRPLGAALVSVPNDDGPYLTSWREGTQERRGPKEGSWPYFADLAGDCHLLPSRDLNAGPVPSRGPAMPTSDDTAAPPPCSGLRVPSPPSPSTGPAAFNSINLSIAQKLEQLRRRGRGQRRYPGACHRGRRPRLLGRRRPANHWRAPPPTIPSRPWSASC